MNLRIILLSLMFLLTACSTPHHVFKGQRHLPVRQESNLVGKSAMQIKKSMGAPLMVRKEDPNQVWTYRTGNCTTLVYLDKNEKVCYAESRGTCSTAIALNEIKNKEDK